jgi:hypothetical protein
MTGPMHAPGLTLALCTAAVIGREVQAGIAAIIATSPEDPLAYVWARTAHFAPAR